MLTPDQRRLAKARELYIKLATEKERLSCEVAELRLDRTKREFDNVGGLLPRQAVRAQADLTQAQKQLLAATERAAQAFDEATK